MSTRISVQIKGDKVAVRMFERIARKVTDMSDVLKDVALPWFRESEFEQFESTGAAGGSVWARLTARYAYRKALSGHGGRLLVRTDALRSSLVATTGDSIVKILKTQATFGSKLMQKGQHGWFAQHGFMTRKGWAVAPRKPIQISGDQERKLVKELETVLVRRMKGQGR